MTVLKFGLVLLALKPAFKFLLKLRKPKPKKPNFMELGLSAITRAYETNEKKNASNQAIIDSWND
jgi:hypothetical protein